MDFSHIRILRTPGKARCVTWPRMLTYIWAFRGSAMRGIWILVALAIGMPACAQTTAHSPSLAQSSASSSGTPAPQPLAFEGADIEATVFLVMMTAAREAEEDLRTLLASMQDANRKKREARRASKLATVGDNPCAASRVADWRMCLLNVEGKIAKLPAAERAELDGEIDRLQENLDDLSDADELRSLKLQMAMDRLSKLMSTLSNIQKKMSDTAQSISQNIK